MINLLGSLVFLIPVCLSILYFSYNYVINSCVQLEGSLEERGLHGVFLLKSLIWVFAIMLILQGIYIIFVTKLQGHYGFNAFNICASQVWRWSMHCSTKFSNR